MKKITELSLLIICMVGLLPFEARAETYAIVVNAANQSDGSGEKLKQEIKRLYLKQAGEWSDGSKAKPISPESGSDSYNAFLAGILDMAPAKLAQHWLRLKQTSGQTPPREVSSTSIAVKLVARDAGAFTIVPDSELTSLPEGVRILMSF